MRIAPVRSFQIVMARFVREPFARRASKAGMLITLLAVTLSAGLSSESFATEPASANALANDRDVAGVVDIVVGEVRSNAVAVESLAKSALVAGTFAIASSDPGGLVALDAISQAALDKALDEGFAASGIPGVAVGLWIPGKGSWVATRGLADLQTGRPMAPDLQAPIGSITKSFTATIALQLVGEGKLHLEDTIDRWYAQIPYASAISVKMLLNHSSGFPDVSQIQLDLHCADPSRHVSPDELIEAGIALPRAPFAPGKGVLYSSLNTIILGRIMEEVAGQSFGAIMSERLLVPLALHRTKLDTDGRLDPPFSHGYTDFCPNLPRRTDTSEWPQMSFAAGALASTLSDLRAWGIALGEGFGLTPALRQARLDDGLGLGVQRDPKSGRVISMGHAGSEPGYSANIQYYSCTRAVWALMGNGDGGTGEAFFTVLKALQPIIESLAAPTVGCPGSRARPDRDPDSRLISRLYASTLLGDFERNNPAVAPGQLCSDAPARVVSVRPEHARRPGRRLRQPRIVTSARMAQT